MLDHQIPRTNPKPKKQHSTRLHWLLQLGFLFFSVQHALAIDPVPISLNWNLDPKLDFKWQQDQETPKLDMDIRDFESPLADVRLNAAQRLLRSLHHPSLNKEHVSDAIAARLVKGETQPAVRKALVSCLCEVADGNHASLLWKLVVEEPDLSPIVERYFIRCESPLALEVWRSRIGTKYFRDQDIILACRGLASLGSPEDATNLAKEIDDITRSDAIRIEAARSISALSQLDLLPLAERVRNQDTSTANMLAALLLRKQPASRSGVSLKAFFERLLETKHGPTQRLAYEWLCENSPERAHAKAIGMLSVNDSGIRRLAVTLMRNKQDEQSFRTLVKALNDANIDIRQLARENLLLFASQSELNEKKVNELIGVVFGLTHWRAKEQCIRLAVELKQAQHASTIAELLDHPETDLSIVAAWGLKHLAESELVLSKMLQHAQQWADTFDESHAIRVAHLLEAFGIHRFAPAQELLMRYVPRTDKFHLVNRISGTWAAGKMWETQSNPGLQSQLHARITDKNNLSPELESVRFAATLALGFLADPSSRQTLEAMDEPGRPIGYATTWAIRRIDDRPK
jgi:hypothetical protein